MIAAEIGGAISGLDFADAGGTGTLTDFELAVSAARLLGPFHGAGTDAPGESVWCQGCDQLHGRRNYADGDRNGYWIDPSRAFVDLRQRFTTRRPSKSRV